MTTTTRSPRASKPTRRRPRPTPQARDPEDARRERYQVCADSAANAAGWRLHDLLSEALEVIRDIRDLKDIEVVAELERRGLLDYQDEDTLIRLEQFESLHEDTAGMAWLIRQLLCTLEGDVLRRPDTMPRRNTR